MVDNTTIVPKTNLYAPDASDDVSEVDSMYDQNAVSVIPKAIPESAVKNRTTMYQMAQSNLQASVNQTTVEKTADKKEIEQRVRDGKEEDLRTEVAVQADQKLTEHKLRVMNEIFKDPQFIGNKAMRDQVLALANSNDPSFMGDKMLVEKLYGREVLRDQIENSTVAENFIKENGPDWTNEVNRYAGDIVAKRQGFIQLFEDLQGDKNEYFGRDRQDDGDFFKASSEEALSYGKTFLPTYSKWLTRSPADDWEGGERPWDQWFGHFKDREAEYERIWSITDPEQALEKVKERLESIRNAGLIPGQNWDSAQDWLSGLLSYGKSDAQLDAAMSVFDIGLSATVIGGLKAVKKVGGKLVDSTGAPDAAAEYALSVKDAVRSAMGMNAFDPAQHARDMGNIDEAVRRQARTDFSLAGFDDNQRVENLLPSMMNVGRWIRDSENLSVEAQRRVALELAEDSTGVLGAFTEGLKINRLSDLTPDMKDRMVRAVQSSIKRKYDNEHDSIMNIDPFWNQATNTFKAHVTFGKTDMTGWETSAQARNYISDMGYNNAKVHQVGTRFFVRQQVDISETDGLLDDIDLPMSERTPTSTMRWLNRFTTGNDNILSAQTATDTKVALTGTNELGAYIQSVSKNLTKLGRGARKRLYKFVEADRVHQQVVVDPVTGAEKTVTGRFAKSAKEFEERYYDMFKRRPRKREYQAYVDWIRLNDLDYAFNNLKIYKDKVRNGIEMFEFQRPGTNATPWGKVEGKAVDDIDWNANEDAGILAIGSNNLEFFHKNNNIDINKDIISRRLKEGWKIVQLSPTGRAKMMADDGIKKTVGKEEINYVIVRNHKSQSLDYRQIPYREGGHIKYEDGFYVGAPKITKLDRNGRTLYRYDKDTSLFHFTNRKKAEEVAAKLDRVRIMIKNGVEEAELRGYIARSFSQTFDEITKLFTTKTNKQGETIDPVLSLDETVGVRHQDQRLGDIQNLKNKYGDDFLDTEDDPFNLYKGMNLSFTGERGRMLDTMVKPGDDASPIFVTRQAGQVSAPATMQRALKHIIDSRFYDDLRIKEANKFIREFSDVLDVNPRDLKSDPFKAFMDPKWKETGVDPVRLASAKAANMALRNFMGQRTPLSNNLRAIKHWVADKIFDTVGDGKVFDFIEPALMHTSADPIRVIRSLAFHTKLGLFSPVQLWLQASAWSHVVALAGPVDTAKATAAYTLQRYLGFNSSKAMRKEIAKHARALGWNEKEFLESTDALRESGWDRIGGEVSVRSDYFDPKVVQGKFSKALDFSTLFFTEGEKFPRMVAWNAAYLKWRKANPGKVLDNKAKGDILNEADLYAINMTAASNAVWQRGALSMMTQFWAYQARLVDQLLGKRLTKVQKARVLGTYAVLYGIPTSLSAYTGFLPWQDLFKEEMDKRGIEYDDETWKNILVNGVIATGLKEVTGEQYDVSRFGPNGIPAPYDTLMGDQDASELMFGVGGTVLMEILEAGSPVAGDVWRTLTGEPPEVAVVQQNLSRLAREASSVSSFTKMWWGINTGQYLSKRGTNLGELNKSQAILQFFGGITPEDISKGWRMRKILKAEKQAKAQAFKKAVEWMRMAYREKDEKTRLAYEEEAKMYLVAGGMYDDASDWGRFVKESTKGQEAYMKEVRDEWMFSSPERLQKEIDEVTDGLGR